MRKVKQILITGATGLLGSSILPYLNQNGFDVISHGHKLQADFNGDLTSKTWTDQLLNTINPQIIINLVALTNVDRCEEHPNQAYLLNVKPIENIISWIRKNHQTYLIHISTDQVYDNSGPHNENDITLTNTYAFSKYCAEQIASKVDSTILRTNFFGKSQHAKTTSFSDWLIESFKNQKKIKLFTDVMFTPLSIDTLQEMIGIVIKNPKIGVYNLGSHEGLSKRDFALKLAKQLNLNTDCAKDCTSKELNLKAYRPLDMRMDSHLFEKAFGINLPLLTDEITLFARKYEI